MLSNLKNGNSLYLSFSNGCEENTAVNDKMIILSQNFSNIRGAWMSQSVRHLTSSPVMISWFMGSSLASGSELTAWSLEPASDSVSPSLSDPPLFTLFLSTWINVKNFFFQKLEHTGSYNQNKKKKKSLIKQKWEKSVRVKYDGNEGD